MLKGIRDLIQATVTYPANQQSVLYLWLPVWFEFRGQSLVQPDNTLAKWAILSQGFRDQTESCGALSRGARANLFQGAEPSVTTKGGASALRSEG